MSEFQIGWFSTGRDKAARDLLQTVQDAIVSGEINGRLSFVFCSREPGESAESDLFIRLAESYGVPAVSLSYRKFAAGRGENGGSGGLPPWRLEYDRAVMEKLKGFKPDLCVLAGYMLIVGREMCRAYDLLNLHPAAPGGPAGTWQEVIWQLIESRARQTGVMMHLATPELDRGPVVTYCRYPIRGKDFDRYWQEIEGKTVAEIKRSQGEQDHLFQTIRGHGLAREFPLIIATLKAFSEGRVRITPDKRVVDSTGNRVNGYDLTADIEKAIQGQNSN